MRIANQNLLGNATIQDCIETLCTPDGVGTKMKQAILDKYTQEITQQRIIGSFCCQAAEKMYYLTDSSASVPISFCGQCVLCRRSEPYSYHVPESLWRKIVPEKHWNDIVCAGCFDILAR